VELGLPAQVFADRRARYVAQLGEGVALLPGGHLVRRVNDTDHVFRQRSDFLYLTGFAQADAVALLSQQSGAAPSRLGAGPHRTSFVLFVQPRDRDAETWNGRRPGVDGAVSDFGATAAHPIGELRDKLASLIDGAPRLFHRFGDDAALDDALLAALADLRRRERFGARAPAEIVDPYLALHEMRMRKDAEELALMRRAAQISAEAHHAAARRARVGAYEYELEAELAYVFRRQGGSGPAYSSIVATGENATILHYTENDAELRAGELVLIDAGVEYGAYASDVTRTYPVGGRFEGAARDVYTAVLRAQHAALAVAHPGTSLRAMHQAAVRSLTESLIELGALEGAVDELIEKETYKRYYMHGTGHFLGLDVHDVGAALADGKPRPLDPGVVFTVEPGLYFRPDEPGCPEPLRGIGVRIEDDVLLTDTGCEVLTAAIPKEVADVEAWMRD
jgi:Xaa-Pro aminopeptidase